MNDTTQPDNSQPDAAVTEQTRRTLQEAEKGGAASRPATDTPGTEAAEQEASDGPPGRGLAR